MQKNSLDSRLIRLALKEDIGKGDITTGALGLKGQNGRAAVFAKSDGVISGVDQFKAVFRTLSSKVSFSTYIKNGGKVFSGDRVIRVAGPLDSLLTGERAAMNILSHLSGVATLTAKFVEKIKGFPAKILDTRKTLPGMRAWEKAAVKHGGGTNHRHGLYDMYLIKENHIAGAGGILKALGTIRKHSLKTGAKIEIEVRNITELRIVLPFRPDYILLDNFSSRHLKKAVEITKAESRKTVLEASGNINLKNVAGVAASGVDRISIGALTHSAPALDLSFRISD
ncbi:MAG: carboxylating nicotinate-nucleotide diphosphorylase [Candidatus Zixiibacteriota bacterium]|nr:MAG: carboxylating nicotinate-nucleotide diphosphorylase [candidate division Zixibacteria bacterium]